MELRSATPAPATFGMDAAATIAMCWEDDRKLNFAAIQPRGMMAYWGTVATTSSMYYDLALEDRLR